MKQTLLILLFFIQAKVYANNHHVDTSATDSAKNGKFRTYAFSPFWTDKQIEKIEKWKNDKKHGKWKYYGEDNETLYYYLERTEKYLNGHKTGKWKIKDYSSGIVTYKTYRNDSLISEYVRTKRFSKNIKIKRLQHVHNFVTSYQNPATGDTVANFKTIKPFLGRKWTSYYIMIYNFKSYSKIANRYGKNWREELKLNGINWW